MAEQWFNRLLHLFPPVFRREYGDQMLDVFRAIRADANLTTFGGRVRFFARILRDSLTTASRAWLAMIGGAHRASNGETRRGSTSERLGQDARFALRMIGKRPGFTAVVVTTLALGIGANTAIFTLVNEVVLQPLPIGDPAAVVDVYAETPAGNSFSSFSYPNYLDYRGRNDVLTDLAAFMGTGVRLGDGMGTEPVAAQFTTANYFDVLQVSAASGRTFRPEEGIVRSGRTVAVVSHGYWERRAGGDPGFLGSTIRLSGTPFTVVGITPEGFNGTFIGFPIEVWLPLPTAELVQPNLDLTDRSADVVELIGRLRPGVSLFQARAAFDVMAEQLEAEHSTINRGKRARIAPTTGVDHALRGGVLSFLGILMVVTGLVLLITCLNVGSMLLARATSRQREMAIRLALGAGRGRLVMQLLTEAVVLFALGGIGGAIVADRLTHALLTLVATVPVPIGFQLAIDWRVLLFTAAVALLTALLAGLFPAREALRQDPISALRVGGDQDERRASRLRNAFVVAQTAGAVVLMVVAGLFVRSLREGMNIDPGFEADRVAATALVLPETKYDPERGRLLQRDLENRIGRLAEVESVALAARRPIGMGRNPIEIQVPGYEPPPPEPALLIETNAVGTTYFTTLDIPVVAGRGFLRSDVHDGRRVAIVNTTAAERFWPGNDPVGKQFTVDDDPVTVVGVAAASRYLIQDDAPIGYVYFPAEQAYSPQITLLVRSSGDPIELRTQIQDIIATIDPDLPAIRLVTLRQAINFSLLPQRVAAAVTAALGIFGLALAALGVYGILAHAVGRRTREIGIRLALGSRPASVVGLIVASGMRLVAAGVLLGTGLALVVTPLLRTFLVGVAPADPITLTTVIIVFVSVASIACLLPARRAIKIDPTMTLRLE